MLFAKEKNKEKRAVIIITATYLVICVIAGIEKLLNISETLNWLIILLGIVILPVLLLIHWYMYIKSYVESEVCILVKNKRIWFCLILAIIYLYGICSLLCFREIVDYVTNNINLLDGLYMCVGIKLGLFLLWTFGWLMIVKCSRGFVNEYKVQKKLLIFLAYILVGIILISINKTQENYVYKHTERVFYEKMIEYYEKNQDDIILEQFKRH